MTRAAKLIVTRGLPGSGKTTWAKAQDGTVRVNRDDLREMLFGLQGVLPWDQEELVSEAQRAAVRSALQQDRTVIVDDTNLRLKYVRVWEQLAAEEQAAFEVINFNTPLAVCCERARMRAKLGGRYVPQDVIITLNTKFLAQHGGELPAYEYSQPQNNAVRQYVPDTDLPPAVVVDIDGTLAHRVECLGSMRSPFDWHRVDEDVRDLAITVLVRALHERGIRIVYVSGRDGACEEATYKWIVNHVGIPAPLFMRPAGDNRKDTVVKSEIFWNNIADKYNVLFTLDDRDSVVKMWRDMGIKCLQVQPGAF